MTAAPSLDALIPRPRNRPSTATVTSLEGGTKATVAAARLSGKIARGTEEITSDDLASLRNDVDFLLGSSCRSVGEKGGGKDGIKERGRSGIPYLNRKLLNVGQNATANRTDGNGVTIVRYVGMVQDMLDPEYYASKVRGVHTKYRDYYDSPGDVGQDDEEVDVGHNLAERYPLVMVPVPFASGWFADGISPKDGEGGGETDLRGFGVRSEEGQRTGKRPLEPCVGTRSSNADGEEGEVSALSSPAHKRGAHNTNIDIDIDDALSPLGNREGTSALSSHGPVPSSQADGPTYAGKTGAVADVDWWPSGCMGSDPSQTPVLAKLYYGEEDSDMEQDKQPRLKLNDLVEVVGVLSTHPYDADFTNQGSNATAGGGRARGDEELNGMGTILHVNGEAAPFWEEDVMMGRLVLPPPSLLPRLHVLCYKRLDVDETAGVIASMQQVASAQDACDTDDRTAAIRAFSKYVFDGDETAAEALLMALLSTAERGDGGSISTRVLGAPVKTPQGTTLGCASLNVVCPTVRLAERIRRRLVSVLDQIVPVAGEVALSLDALNNTTTSQSNAKTFPITPPAKNESGRLVPSVVQLPKGSTLLLDESSEMMTGHLGPQGQRAVMALSKLTRDHCVPYRFEGGMEYDFEGDFRIVVISALDEEGRTRTGGGGSRESSKRLLPCALRVQLSGMVNNYGMDLADQGTGPNGLLPPALAARVRSYLARCRTRASSCGDSPDRDGCAANINNNNIRLTKAVLDEAQKDFIQRRVEGRKRLEQERRHRRLRREVHAVEEEAVGEEDFHRWLTLTRLLARSRWGNNVPNIDASEEALVEDWKDALRLDDAMRK